MVVTMDFFDCKGQKLEIGDRVICNTNDEFYDMPIFEKILFVSFLDHRYLVIAADGDVDMQTCADCSKWDWYDCEDVLKLTEEQLTWDLKKLKLFANLAGFWLENKDDNR
jgi:hypothetical protein